MTTMSAKTFIDTVLVLPPDISVLIRGNHGIGKSGIVAQVTDMLSARDGIAYTLIDKRLSQTSEGDMLGLPSIDDIKKGVTRFNPPDWYKMACDKPCVLFFDELNRAVHEVMQASFQIVLDRECSFYKLHPMTRVFSAVNVGSGYSVNEIDPALLDRFWTIDFDPDIEDWTRWARAAGVDATIIDFVVGNPTWLDPPKNANQNDVHPSRRSWERLSRSLQHTKITDNPNDPLYYAMSVGFVGTPAAIALQAYACDVNARITAEEVMETYSDKKSSARRKTKKLGQDAVGGLIDSVAHHVITNWALNEQGKMKNVWEDRHSVNIKLFTSDLGDELKLAFWSKMSDSLVENLELLQIVHDVIVEYILAIFKISPDSPEDSKPVIPEFARKSMEQQAEAATPAE